MRVSPGAARPRALRAWLIQRRALVIAIGIGSLLVIARSAVFLYYPQSFFDSDQAIIGLMAKHLVEGRAFPLFYYGQTYLLGVDAWIAAPFFLIGGPTVAALHASVIFTNLVIAAVLIASLTRYCGLGPFEALIASLFFTFAPPFTSASLIEAGANIGPFLYVLLVWIFRERPLWLGAVLAFGFLNREFTIYALPALVAVQVFQNSFFRVDRVRSWLIAGVAFFAVWQAIDALRPFADMMGPGTRGEPVPGAAASQVSNILERVAVVPAELFSRVRVMALDYFPREIGAHFVQVPIASQGRDWVWRPLGLGLVAASLRALVLNLKRRPFAAEPRRSSAFGWYLSAVGLIAAVVYVLTRPAEGGVVDRYILLTIYLPVGISAALLSLETRAWIRRGMAGLILGWAVLSAVDHGRLLNVYWGRGEPDEVQDLADELVRRGITVAEAGYWRAYRVTFLSRERVKVASSDVARIDEYQRLADEQGDGLITIQEAPCAGDRVGQWYLCRGAP